MRMDNISIVSYINQKDYLPSFPDLILNPTKKEFIIKQGIPKLVAWLRESFASRGISLQASDLLLSLRRDKTNSSYNSQFAKWASWCEQRNRNPIAGPVKDVVNFLAEFFKCSSLNAAISSVQERIRLIPAGNNAH